MTTESEIRAFVQAGIARAAKRYIGMTQAERDAEEDFIAEERQDDAKDCAPE
ncbi:MAG: hypothetical protein JWR85_4217 [Marmoricola sp.]|nr:hypothetical protein [Marmoricola sp.]